MRVIFGIVFMISLSVYCQDRNRIDSLALFSSINREIKNLNSDEATETLVLKDNSGNAILIWKTQRKYCSLIANYRSPNKSLRKMRISKKNRDRLDYIFQNKEEIMESDLKDCFEDAYNITRVWLNFNDQGYNYSFDTNCKQEKLVKPLYALYFSLFR
ncbi:hypothetical protein MACH07_21890 [Flagellimonas marinaquae]|uniref:Uncharacterized protein n=1 Tax=Flagellimonas marinaquae TaxID=254955 RepID=A0AA48HF94_9FLAO|nr:hypothetical protein MACH07_21890 [Allomuricauda aquimarina]